MSKKCQKCKKDYAINRFTCAEKPDKVYANCHDCRLKLVTLKNKCNVCGIGASYNYEGVKTGVRCQSHKEPEMVNVKSKMCEKCAKKRAYFNSIGFIKPLLCVDCKLPDMIDVNHRLQICQTCKKKKPVFNYKDEKTGIMCGDCKLPNMIDVVSKKCQTCNKKRPYFNYETEIKALFCGDCKLQNMVDIIHNKCQKCNKKRPVFNFQGYTKPIMCTDCKEIDMINILNKLCQNCEKTQPCFNYPGEKVPIMCTECKLENMVNVKTRMCQTCKKKQPYFNYDGQKIGIFCQDCKEPDMIDVKSIICKEKGCRKRATHAFVGVTKEYCASHKKPGMILNSRKKCIGHGDDDCKNNAIYGLTEPLHCANHAFEDEYDLSENQCKNCKKIDVLNKNGLCVNFCSLEERDLIMKKHVKKREEFINRLLDEEISTKPYSKDEVIDRNCSKKRPDRVYHLGSHVVILEVDENQHKSYKCTAYGDTKEGRLKGEAIRMFEIFQSFDGVPCIFIRYNPDNFTNKDGKNVKITQSKRHDILIRWVKRCMRMVDTSGLIVKYLFYDGHDDTDSVFNEIKEEDVL
uniref:Uncharacterized protein n=1 Tax=viral metagenome TaxID=1070528 RepID=A0A6C0KF38_9ZZZZ